MLNAYYDSHERYVFAVAEQMKKEYEYIHAQGLVLQLDAPDLAMERTFLFQDTSVREFQQIVEIHIAGGIHTVDRASFFLVPGGERAILEAKSPTADVVVLGPSAALVPPPAST